MPTLPVYLGELQARSLGAAVEAWDPDGKPLIDEVGELVITRPMPSMPVFFWGDEDGTRYRDCYFDVYPGIWRHGDWIEITSRETAIIYGRSDSTINRGGVRMGTSEIYRAVLAVDDGHRRAGRRRAPGGQRGWMPLFVVLREGRRWTTRSIGEIRRRIREDCSPRHVPDEIRQIDEVPRTLSGKVLEVPVKRILMGTPRRTGGLPGVAGQPGGSRLLRESRPWGEKTAATALLGALLEKAPLFGANPATPPDAWARIDNAIAALARRQHGYVTREQLLALGLGPACDRLPGRDWAG